MRSRYSLVVTLAVMMAGASLLSGACAAKRKDVLTEQQILAILDDVDKAANRRDVDGICAHMADDIRIKVMLIGFGDGRDFTFNRQQYKDYTKQGFQEVKSYTYTRKKTKVTIEPGGIRATVRDQICETIIVGNQTVKTVTDGTGKFMLKDGKVVMTSLEGITHPDDPATN